jgi:hypothetical protein
VGEEGQMVTLLKFLESTTTSPGCANTRTARLIPHAQSIERQ